VAGYRSRDSPTSDPRGGLEIIQRASQIYCFVRMLEGRLGFAAARGLTLCADSRGPVDDPAY
jgi:hypothetical protein